MKKRRIALLLIFSLLLLAQLQSVAQEKPIASEQERSVAEGQAREKQAASRAEAQKKREADRAEAQVKRAAAREKYAAAREAFKQKQAIAKAKAEEKRVAAELKRSIDEAIRRTLPPDGTFKLLGSRLNLNPATVVKGAPYSATAITESIQTLGDGNQIIQRNEAAYYRDREGRIRIDQTLKSIGKWTVAGDPARIITIWDPVAGHSYSLNPREQTALIDPNGPLKKFALLRSPNKPPLPPDISDHPKPKGPSVNKPKSDPVTTDSPDRRKKESLGTKTIEGVSADGTRTTRIIPAGEIGNVRPIEIVDESWYSPELQMLLLTRHKDPRSGEANYRLTNIKRIDPEPALFEIPGGYRTLDKTTPRSPSQPPRAPNKPKPAKKTEVIL